MWWVTEPRLGPREETRAELMERMERFAKEVQADLAEQKGQADMGDFNINITATGGHGCDRKAKEGEKLYARCRRMDCPDCLAHEFVEQLKHRGMFGSSPAAKAELTHWPGQQGQVVDDMLTNTRKSGQF